MSSVIKSDNDTILIRLYNPTEKEIKGKLKLGFDVKEARSIRLDGKVRENLRTENKSIDIKVSKGKIYTIEVL